MQAMWSAFLLPNLSASIPATSKPIGLTSNVTLAKKKKKILTTLFKKFFYVKWAALFCIAGQHRILINHVIDMNT